MKNSESNLIGKIWAYTI